MALTGQLEPTESVEVLMQRYLCLFYFPHALNVQKT